MDFDYSFNETDGVIFDLDGTLWDSTQEIADAWNELLKTRPDIIRGPITREELFSNMGLPMYDIAANLFPNERPEVRNALMDDMGIFENGYLEERGAVLFDGVAETVEKIAEKVPVFIVSNCQDGYIEAFMKAHAFEGVFKDHECWGRTGMSKAENIKAVIDRNNIKKPVYIGDTDSDSKACANAGVPFVFAQYGFGNTERYDAKVKCMKDFRSLII